MTSQSGPELAVGQVPDFHCPIPRGGHNRRLKVVRAESDAADPISVAITVLNGVLALTESVPELDGAVTRGRHDLAVIHRERHREYVLGVTDEAAGRGTGSQIPEPEFTVPASRKRELAIGGEDNVLNKMRMTSEATAGDAIGLVILGEVPEDDGLVP